MPAPLEPIKRVRCTYKDCAASFDTEKEMKYHKKRAPEHDYCQKCDEDFDSYDEYTLHKAFRPDNHHLACRVCGEELKSKSGLNLHIEMKHRVDQKLPCLGCGDQFHRCSLLIEHLEFGHCPSISASQFHGHIIHKHLIGELLKGGVHFHRFMEKISKYDAAMDMEEEGGVTLIEENHEDARGVDFNAILPEVPDTAVNPTAGPYPPLPKAPGDTDSELAFRLKAVGLGTSDNGSGSVTAVPSVSGDSVSTVRASQAWNKGRASKTLFPKAKPTPAPSEFSVEQRDRQMELTEGINIMNTRFWDPESPDWNPIRFYDSMVQKYYCPFICEQNYDIPEDLTLHIMQEHRISKMRCPSCLKLFNSCTSLVAHCETGGKRCKIRKTDDYGTFLDRLTGGFLGVEERVRPDHENNPTVQITNPLTGQVEHYQPPTAIYLQYSVTKPVDWKEPKERQSTITIGQR